MGGNAEGYAIVPSVSYGLSTAARAVEPQLGKDDSILILEEGFPSNVLPWLRVSRERGAKLITVPVPSDGNWTNAIISKLDKSISVVALFTCHWTNGAFIDLSKIRKAIGDDVMMAIDATQSLGAMPFPMDDVRPDFLVSAGYKWLLCPYGFSIMYVSEKWQNARPLEESWQARENKGRVPTSLVLLCSRQLFSYSLLTPPSLLLTHDLASPSSLPLGSFVSLCDILCVLLYN